MGSRSLDILASKPLLLQQGSWPLAPDPTRPWGHSHPSGVLSLLSLCSVFRKQGHRHLGTEVSTSRAMCMSFCTVNLDIMAKLCRLAGRSILWVYHSPYANGTGRGKESGAWPLQLPHIAPNTP